MFDGQCCSRNPKQFRAKDALQWMWTALPRKTIAKGVKDFRKRLEACVLASVGHFEHKI